MFGPAASDPAAWRLLAQLDETMPAELCAAGQAAWAQHAETRDGRPTVACPASGR